MTDTNIIFSLCRLRGHLAMRRFSPNGLNARCMPLLAEEMFPLRELRPKDVLYECLYNAQVEHSCGYTNVCIEHVKLTLLLFPKLC